MKNMNMKILHSPTNIADQMNIIATAQKKLGYTVDSCTYNNTWFKYKYDHNLSLEKTDNKFIKKLKILNFAIPSFFMYNVFHFHFGNSLFPRNYDLPILNLLNKKMVMHYWGSEVRRKSIAKKNNKYVKVKMKDEELIIDNIKKVAKWINVAIVADYETYLYVNDFFERVEIIPQSVNLDEFEPKYPSLNKKEVVIVHAPSDKDIKGTEYIKNAVDKLKKIYNINFITVHGVPHHKAKKIYKKADIIVDQLLLGSHGIFSIEAMALGKPVICYIRKDLKDKYPNELPIISANPENIYNQLEKLIKNSQLRNEIGQKGRKYVESYHDALKNAKKYIELYKEV